MRAVQRSGSGIRTVWRCRCVDHHVVVREGGRGVFVPWQQHGVLPAKARGEGPRGRELAGLDLAIKATEQVGRGV